MSKIKEIALYIIITNPTLPYTKIAELCVKNEIKMLQLREKHDTFTDKELLKIAREIKSITIGSDTLFIVNDRIDICLLSNADGVHLGQDDLSFEDACRLVCYDKLIGVSTHNLNQAEEALKHKPDYIGFGPVFQTPTKKIP